MQQNTGEGMRIEDPAGQRLYLAQSEREAFEAAADSCEDRDTRTLCLVLLFTGCRLSEALNLTAGCVLLDEGVINFESLKKRKRGVYRRVPIPPALLNRLDDTHGIRRLQRTKKGRMEKLWPWVRATGFRKVKAVMKAAAIEGPQASPKGLRHAYGVRAVTTGVPLSSLQRWLGHAQLSTTAIYAQAVGEEEKALASRMW